MATLDPNLTPREQIVRELNRKYKTVLEATDVIFDVPIQVIQTLPINGTMEEPAWNATVVLRNAEGLPYEFNTTLHFTRLPLAELFSSRNTTFVGPIRHTHELLPQLSTRLGMTIRPEDIVGHTIDDALTYPLTMWLIAADPSLLLFGQVEITILAGSDTHVET